MMPPDPNYQNGRPSELLDFTDKLRRLGESPSAHSANASIWHCTHAINQVQEQVRVMPTLFAFNGRTGGSEGHTRPFGR